jgi:NADPH:quinone reductase-like Zn-dependent oxidoreductase
VQEAIPPAQFLRNSRFQVGDRVMSLSQSMGAYAEHIVVDEKILAYAPKSLKDVAAPTLPIPALTAWGALHPGIKALIHGASGNCGAFAVQFANAAGAKVVGTASGKNREYVLGSGADEFIDYQTEQFEERTKDIDLVLAFFLVGGEGTPQVGRGVF